MKALALDVGDATVGMAISDELGISANGLVTLRRTSLDQDLAVIGEVVKEQKADCLVIGMPYNMDGSLSEQTKKTLAFKEKLARLGLPIVEIDERWTTMAAEQAMLSGDLSRKKRKKKVDKVAAILILRTYLDSQADKT